MPFVWPTDDTYTSQTRQHTDQLLHSANPATAAPKNGRQRVRWMCAVSSTAAKSNTQKHLPSCLVPSCFTCTGSPTCRPSACNLPLHQQQHHRHRQQQHVNMMMPHSSKQQQQTKAATTTITTRLQHTCPLAMCCQHPLSSTSRPALSRGRTCTSATTQQLQVID